MNVWADVVLKHPHLLKDIPPDVVMLNWEYNAGGWRMVRTGEIARAGLALVVCPGTSAWQTHGTRLANAVANVAQFAAAGRRWEAEGLLNTDWGDFGHRNFLGVSLHGLAHAAAHAWHGRAVDDEQFTGVFCFHVFHQKSDHLARALRLLGDSYRLCGGDNRNGCPLYHALVEPLARKEVGGYRFARIDQTNPEGLQRIIEALSSKRLWPKGAEGMDRFEALAMREFTVAAAMDVLACRRALAAKDLRAGKTIPRRELAGLTEGMREISQRFAVLWQARNKPSGLADNLALMHRAEAETRRLSHRS
jgi:hypothetical protein